MHSCPAATIAEQPLAQEASELLRNCVHCGFCLPACPTYRITGNELDSPRGRIYLIKEMLEQGAASETTRRHLDRCLTCRACETACPSGVRYGRLADLGRELIEQRPPSPRTLRERFVRFGLLTVATRRRWFTPLVRCAQWLRPLLPHRMASLVPPRTVPATRLVRAAPAPRTRRVAILEGCVQPGLAPQINAAAVRVLEALGYAAVPAKAVGCCGAMEHHLGRTEAACAQVRRNVDACVRLLDDGVETIVSTASGCGTFAKDYAHVLRSEDQARRLDAARVAAATRDLCELIDPTALRGVIAGARDRNVRSGQAPLRVAWQAPCSLQHGQRAATAGKVEAILRATGCELTATANATLCCGSAGSYSIFQPELSRELRARKLRDLGGGNPDVIATANIGCLEHLRQASAVPVKHWIEIVEQAVFDR